VRSGTNTLRILSEIAQNTPQTTLDQFHSLISAHQYRLSHALVRRFLPPGAHVLDWGVGNGHFSFFLTREGYRATGYSLEPCEFANFLPTDSSSFVQGNREDPVSLPFADGLFDAVTSVGVLEHVRETGGNEIQSLVEIWRVTKPGGLFLCFHLPNRFSFIERVAALFPGKYRHEVRFARHQIETLLRSAGWEVILIRRYGVLPRNLWQRFPSRIRNSALIAGIWDGVDMILERVVNPICQNFAVVARRGGAQL
jgi:SAM-dependent methyltransferase